MDMKLQVGDQEAITKKILELDVYRFAELCGDFNPVHVDDGAARRSRFGKRICHGAYISSLVSAVLGMKLPGEGTIYLEQHSQFLAPVYIGDTVTAMVQITDITDKRNGQIVKLITDVYNQDNCKVMSGYAVVMI